MTKRTNCVAAHCFYAEQIFSAIVQIKLAENRLFFLCNSLELEVGLGSLDVFHLVLSLALSGGQVVNLV